MICLGIDNCLAAIGSASGKRNISKTFGISFEKPGYLYLKLFQKSLGLRPQFLETILSLPESSGIG